MFLFKWAYFIDPLFPIFQSTELETTSMCSGSLLKINFYFINFYSLGFILLFIGCIYLTFELGFINHCKDVVHMLTKPILCKRVFRPHANCSLCHCEKWPKIKWSHTKLNVMCQTVLDSYPHGEETISWHVQSLSHAGVWLETLGPMTTQHWELLCSNMLAPVLLWAHRIDPISRRTNISVRIKSCRYSLDAPCFCA